MTDTPWTDPELVAATAAVLASIGGLLRAFHGPRLRFAGLALLLGGWFGLIGSLAPDAARTPLLAVPLLVVVAIGWFVAGLSSRWELILLTIGAAVVSLRVPVPTGDGTSMLLGPLYAVTAFGAVVLARREWHDARRLTDRGIATRLLDIGVALYPAVATLSILWSVDRASSIEQLAFFLVPFQIVYALVRAWIGSTSDLRWPTLAYVSTMVVAALVGIYQAATSTVWWNVKVIDANRFRPDFRTNSIFFDPNVYGRALVLAIVLVVAWMLLARLDALRTALGAGAIALFAVALWNTYSQSSWFALAAALLVIAVLTLPPNARRWAAGSIVVVVVVALPFGFDALSGEDADGRGQVVRDGLELAEDRPIAGWGVGAFERAAISQSFRLKRDELGLVASHTTPVTVVAELGVLGSVTFLVMLAAAVSAILARWRRSSSPASAARARGEGDPAALHGWPLPALVFATGAFVALFAHSLLYAGFFEDAMLWVALATLASLPPVEADATS